MDRQTLDGIVFLLVVAAIAGGGCLIAKNSDLTAAPPIQAGLVDGFYRVTRVVDGDTIELEGAGRPLRFRHFDAAEAGTPEGDELTARLTALIEGEVVYVRFARRKRDGRLVLDRYDRFLGDIYIRERDVLGEDDRDGR